MSAYWRWAILIGGLLLPQVIIFWMSLTGAKIPLPLNVLGYSNLLGRQGQEWDRRAAMDESLFLDLIIMGEPYRRFTMDELHAGRLPLWNPHNLGGHPFMATGHSMLFSPYRLVSYLWDSPNAPVWELLLRTVVCGIGAYLFFRITLGVGYWASTVGAWYFPLIGGMAFWGLFTPAWVLSWTPWLLLGVYAAVRRPGGLGVVGLAAATAFMLFAGHLQVAAHALLVAGFYGLWLLAGKARSGAGKGEVMAAAGALGLGWALGMMLGGPQLVPMWEYLGESMRMQNRIDKGDWMRPVAGPAGVLELIYPYFNGAGKFFSWPMLYPRMFLESGPVGAAGIVAAGLLAPAALMRGRNRGQAFFWIAMAVITAGYYLKVPLVYQLLDIPMVNSLSNTRWIMFTGWCVVVLAVIGLDRLMRARRVPRGLGLGAAAVLVLLGVFCLYRMYAIDGIAREAFGGALPGDIDNTGEVIGKFQTMYALCGVLTLFLAVVWLMWVRGVPQGWRAWGRRELGSNLRARTAAMAALGTLGLAEMALYAYGFVPQSDPAWYYPEPGYVEQIKRAQPGRVMGLEHFHANLNLMMGLDDISGYDAFEPRRMVALQKLALWGEPQEDRDAQQQGGKRSLKPGGITDMLGVRYFLTVSDEGDGPTKYQVTVSRTAMERVYVPREVATVNDEKERLDRLVSADFRPESLVLVESRAPLAMSGVSGKAKIVEEDSQRVEVEAVMETPGVLVLADRWDPGWRAEVNGTDAAILCVNHALRGVVLQAGRHSVKFVYDPQSLRVGVGMAALAGLVLAVWAWASWALRRRGRVIDPARSA